MEFKTRAAIAADTDFYVLINGAKGNPKARANPESALEAEQIRFFKRFPWVDIAI
ncbi:MAG: hypothetical protein K9L86_04570 [Candidatus Omnitrophica bacterium]|nr:hypothetical protein [Candidatus Omnitrophota bacterium]